MDQRVLETQVWLNETYGSNENFIRLDEDGITGRGTVKGLIRGLQIELGETIIDGVIGDGTANKFDTMFPNGLSDKVTNVNANITYIIQGGFYCRGIDPCGFSGVYNNAISEAVKILQRQAGLDNLDGIITSIILKAILTTDAYTLSSSGDAKIREIQQGINKRYYKHTGIIPTNGIYDRQTSKALIKALQREINVEADGVWGQGTMNACPTLQRGSSNKNLVYILQYALYVNGFDPNGFDGGFGNGVVNAVKNFQSFVKLDNDGIVGKQTWASLLVSYGDKNRKAHVCDTRHEITTERAKILKNNGYDTVGRYLTGGEFKELRDGELERILNEGLAMFPIFQENGRNANEFYEEQGISHAKKAIEAAVKKGIPNNSIIYFAVDYDVVENDIAKNILPYFKGINEVFKSNLYNEYKYKVGVYGPRQVCSETSKKGYTVSSFVSDMSSGFTGNIGHRLPENWNFDQISNITISDPQYGSLEIDKIIYSERHNVVVSQEKNNYIYFQIKKLYDLAYGRKQDIKEANRLVLDFLRGDRYRKEGFNQIAGIPDSDYIDTVEQMYPDIVPENMNIECGDISINIRHMAVTIESYIVSFIGWIEDIHAYAGWAGDLCQLGAKVQEKYDNSLNKHIFTDTEISKLVGAIDKDAISLGFDSGEATGFGLEDLYQDLDGAIIGSQGIKTVAIPEIFKKYYLEKLYKKRANLFYETLNKTDIQGNTPTDILSEIAKIFTYNPAIYAQIFGKLFGTFDEKIFGDPLAYGFALKIVKMMNEENL